MLFGGANTTKRKEQPMMSVEHYQDRTLTCRDCGQDFTFSVGEQAFYASRGLTNLPGRCPDCRAARRSGGGSGQSYSPRPRAEQFAATCASCGKPTTVPLCLVKGARCIAVIASGRSNPLAVLAAMTRRATAIVGAAMIVAIPVSAVVTGAIAAIAAGKIL